MQINHIFGESNLSSYTKVYSVIYDSGSVPDSSIFSLRETSPKDRKRHLSAVLLVGEDRLELLGDLGGVVARVLLERVELRVQNLEGELLSDETSAGDDGASRLYACNNWPRRRPVI